jgi:hypothetical protein
MEGIGRDLIECQPCICLEGLRNIMESLVKTAIVPAEILTNHDLDPSARWVYYVFTVVAEDCNAVCLVFRYNFENLLCTLF